jgi:UrcA family protein
MRSNIFSLRTLISAALSVATGIATYTANAQQPEGITVEAARPGRSAIGAPINTVTTKRVVSYSDVSLTTPSGVHVLETRIRDAANAACAELVQKYPIAAEGESPEKCVNNAVDGAMVDARKVIDAANQKAPGAYAAAAVPAIQAREEIVVEAVSPGRPSAIGAPINTVTAKRTVSYGDISLTTASGVKVLENRIQEAAKSACTELEQKYPVAAEGDTTKKCIDNAVAGGMANARTAIDAAKVASD